MSTLQQVNRVDIESLHRDFHVDNVLDYVHEGLKVEKDYPLELYKRYEKQRWIVQDLDFEQDRIDWHEKLTEEQRNAFNAIAGGFHHGERQVAVDIIPMLSAMPTDEHIVFLSSHLEDEARHILFFDRFYREATGIEADNIMDTLDQSYHYVSETFVGAFGFLAYLIDELRVNPHDKKLLVSALTNYQMWIEGVLALSTMKLTLGFCKENNVLPGFHKGFLATTRDESRHVQFGMRLLKEMITEDPKLIPVVYDTIATMLAMSNTYVQRVDYTVLGLERDAIRKVMMMNLDKKFKMIGLPLPKELEARIAEIEPESAAGG